MTRALFSPIAFAWVLAACDDPDAVAPGGAAAERGKTGDAKVSAGAAAKGEAKAEAAVDVPAAAKPGDLCKAFDRDAVAASFGWKGMSKVSGVGSSAGGVKSRVCAYAAEEAPTKAHFGATFSTATTFEPRHAGFGVDYEPREPIDGAEAKLAKNDRVVVLQVMAKGLRIVTDVSIEGTPPAELEPKLVAATKTLIATLPADAAAALAK